jgi:integrase/recombinase XerD
VDYVDDDADRDAAAGSFRADQVQLVPVVPYSAVTGVLLSEYLRHRATISRARGPLFLSESRRNRGQRLTLWTWSKVIRKIAVAAGLPRFSTHTTRHLCLTDLARMGWELHAIATFVGYRSTESTLKYINSRELHQTARNRRSAGHRITGTVFRPPQCQPCDLGRSGSDPV